MTQSKKRKSLEDVQLNPELVRTGKTWNPADFVGRPTGSGEVSFVGGPKPGLPPIGEDFDDHGVLANDMANMAMHMNGGIPAVDPTTMNPKVLQQQEDDRKYYADPQRQELIKQLGLEMSPKFGTPIIDDDDEGRLVEAEHAHDGDLSGMDRRTKMIHDLMVTDEPDAAPITAQERAEHQAQFQALGAAHDQVTPDEADAIKKAMMERLGR